MKSFHVKVRVYCVIVDAPGIALGLADAERWADCQLSPPLSLNWFV